MNKLLLLGALCAGLSATTTAQAQLLGGIRNVISPPPCDCNTGGSPRPSLGSLGLRDIAALNVLVNGPLGDAVDGALRIPLPGLDERIPGVLAIGEDIIVRVGGRIGPAPAPPQLPELLQQAIPGVVSIGENVIVRVGGRIGPAPAPPQLPELLQGVIAGLGAPRR
jgi:hypothetical protein